ncbi:AmmeMemoRadiSam system radical SAM enzyme [Roseiconus nitratireducens]|nr:AmmeMemoRadiSam system radical SAM enzyme [Roseiconus nitratireducens]
MATKWYSREPDGRLLCELCPRACRLKDGDRGFCFVRKNVGGQMVLETYGKSTGFCVDPIEKKPLNHFLPGSAVLSFGTAGCNLGCKFCQNWDISKSREVTRLSDRAMPDEIAAAAAGAGCRSVAFTYNDPVIWAEYAIDTAHACRRAGLKSVAVTAGYITDRARGDFYAAMDAANIDLKSFDETFYFKLTGSHLAPVLDTIRYACNETDCWVELTNLVIPDANDSPDEIRRMAQWLYDNVGPNVPLHFTAFHPDFRMTDRPPTPPATLQMAYDVARDCGLNYVYVGNVHDVQRQSTYCHHCGQLLIERDWHQIGRYQLTGSACSQCGTVVPGVFEEGPGRWGARRQRIHIPQIPTVTPEHETDEPAGLRSGVNERISIKQADVLTSLTDQQQTTIHRVASRMVQLAACGGDPGTATEHLGDLADLPIHGVFVTVKRGQTLRGCCGRQGSLTTLGESLADSASRTSRDPRLTRLSPSELPYLELSVSLLGPVRPVEAVGAEREDLVKVGEHGLRIQCGGQGGLLLPQVATEQGWNARQFLDAVCRKAGLPAGAWLNDNTELSLFDGVHFGERLAMDPTVRSRPVSRLGEQELTACRRWVHGNLVAMQLGATPMYYAVEFSDLEVSGLIVSATHPEKGSQQWFQLGVQETWPLQSSLYRMTEQVATWLGREASAEQCVVELAVLADCVHHGLADDSDLSEAEKEGRAVIITDGICWSVCYQQDGDARAVVRSAKTMERFGQSPQLYSMRCECTAETIRASIGPRAQAQVAARPPAVAGQFYPADDSSREALVQELLSDLPDCERRKVFAAMVPHAGLQYSGRVAAEVWRRLEIPQRVLIIGPKHTRDGVDWAVAPHDRWMLSAATSIDGDVATATELAGCLPAMELDSNAHRREHGIEVQLPWMVRFCPQARLTAIAMQGGSLDQLRAAAEALASWLQSQQDPPLLVVSSDMNHFAADAENRRRDRMALDALATGDGERLLRVCQQEDISMCGRLPAALTLMTMNALGIQPVAEEIAYATSADAGGDRTRVVGYAGVIWAP